jgi:hypothetical protein
LSHAFHGVIARIDRAIQPTSSTEDDIAFELPPSDEWNPTIGNNLFSIKQVVQHKAKQRSTAGEHAAIETFA